MTFRFIFLSVSLTLLLIACQSGDSNKSSAGNAQPTATMQHLQQDQRLVQPPTTAAFTVDIFPKPLISADQAVAVLRNCQKESHFVWEVNGNEISNNKMKGLDNTYFQRGDSIHLIAYCGSQTEEKTTIVENTAPAISAVKFQSPKLISGQDLTVIPIAEDLDGDPIEYKYEWVVDGVLLEEFTEATLPGHLLKKGTQVALAVTPYDNFSEGTTFQGLNFFIPNSPPSIISQPPPLSSDNYVYNVEAVDPDGDELNFKLNKGPDGMTINPKTGTLNWFVDPPPPDGNIDIELTVEDPDGLQARQFYTLSLSKPELKN